ncbi:MAG: hypothetical protein J0H49_18690 [Acidobacteria bacterium]|nr:hypothetical protein [Acidobacteriota bacterium]
MRAICAARERVTALFDTQAAARGGKPNRNSPPVYLLCEGRLIEITAFFATIEFPDL